MTSTLHEALNGCPSSATGSSRNLDGNAKSDDQADKAIARICGRAGLPVRLFHKLRHSFGTHAALFGVNPWRLQAWLGPKRIDEMLYVHVADRRAPPRNPSHSSEVAGTSLDSRSAGQGSTFT